MTRGHGRVLRSRHVVTGVRGHDGRLLVATLVMLVSVWPIAAVASGPSRDWDPAESVLMTLALIAGMIVATRVAWLPDLFGGPHSRRRANAEGGRTGADVVFLALVPTVITAVFLAIAVGHGAAGDVWFLVPVVPFVLSLVSGLAGWVACIVVLQPLWQIALLVRGRARSPRAALLSVAVLLGAVVIVLLVGGTRMPDPDAPAARAGFDLVGVLLGVRPTLVADPRLVWPARAIAVLDAIVLLRASSAARAARRERSALIAAMLVASSDLDRGDGGAWSDRTGTDRRGPACSGTGDDGDWG